VGIKNSSEKTGFGVPKSEHVQCPGKAEGRSLFMAWISDDLLAKTQRVWSRAYGRPVSEEEAVEILINVKRTAEVLMRAKQGGDAK